MNNALNVLFFARFLLFRELLWMNTYLYKLPNEKWFARIAYCTMRTRDTRTDRFYWNKWFSVQLINVKSNSQMMINFDLMVRHYADAFYVNWKKKSEKNMLFAEKMQRKKRQNYVLDSFEVVKKNCIIVKRLISIKNFIFQSRKFQNQNNFCVAFHQQFS